VENWLSITIRRLLTFEDKIQGRLKRHAGVELGRHVPVARIGAILPVHCPGHSLKCLFSLLFGYDPVM
jgi:hypothetical protein